MNAMPPHISRRQFNPIWIGTRTPHDVHFDITGLGAQTGSLADTELIATGSLMVEAELRPHTGPQNILRFSTLDPWPMSISLCLEEHGQLRLTMRQGQRDVSVTLQTDIGRMPEVARITYSWDAPARRGWLSVVMPDRSTMWQTDFIAPLPMPIEMARRIILKDPAAKLDASAGYIAIARGLTALGPMPSLCMDALIGTPDGPRSLRDLKPGDWVTPMGPDAGNDPVRILWIGSAVLPMFGRFRPVLLRQPYMGLWKDLNCILDQRIILYGSEIEYLFGEEWVATSLRHLQSRNSTEPLMDTPPVGEFAHILLERPEIISANGALVESFDATCILEHSDWIDMSVLANVPSPLRPQTVGLPAPVLQSFEALTLSSASFG